MAKRYVAARSEHFLNDYVSLTRRNKKLQEQIDKKICQILENPENYKPLKRPLAGYRRVHIGSYVITFRVDGDMVRFVRIAHHDEVYYLPHE